MTATRTKRPRRTKLLAEGMEVEAVPAESRRKAACVLEVLAGLRTPEEGASALGVSLPTYYHLETRALRGLVRGCTPEPAGRKLTLQKRLRETATQCEELQRQVQRYRALLRSAQAAAGLAAPAAAKPSARTKTRKPRVRALRAIEALDGTPPGGSGASS